jgi:adenosine deaminase
MESALLISVIINVVIVGVGVYLSKYLARKADILATNENFEVLLKQVKKTTEATKEIEAKVSNSAWLVQQKWQIKKDFYMEVLEIFNVIDKAFKQFMRIELQFIDKTLSKEERLDLENVQDHALDIISESQEKIQSSVEIIGVLFLERSVMDAIHLFTEAENRRKARIIQRASEKYCKVSNALAGAEITSFQCFIKNQITNFNESFYLLKSSAKKDLSLD